MAQFYSACELNRSCVEDMAQTIVDTFAPKLNE